jgi:nucleoid-associated protein YgaU
MTASTFAQERMTYEDYQAQLYAFQSREKAALQNMDEENAKIEALQKQIAEINAQIIATWDEIFELIGTNQQEYDEFWSKLDQMDAKIAMLERLNPQALLDHVDQLDELATEIEGLRETKFAAIKRVIKRIDSLAARVERLKNALPKPKHDMYTVMRGDYLWRISAKSAIYNDPWKWMRIYSANRDQIKNPDLIYPDQRFLVPRQIGRDEHLVVRGEYLSKIAGYNEVYGDPFKWTKIYQANKANGFISDPNVITPK